jgi:hypothetical protein
LRRLFFIPEHFYITRFGEIPQDAPFKIQACFRDRFSALILACLPRITGLH